MKAITKDDLINICKEKIKATHEKTEEMQELIEELYNTVDSAPDEKVENIKLPWECCMGTLYENEYQQYVSFSKYIDRIMGDVRLNHLRNYNMYIDSLFPQEKKKK